MLLAVDRWTLVALDLNAGILMMPCFAGFSPFVYMLHLTKDSLSIRTILSIGVCCSIHTVTGVADALPFVVTSL